ncbi:MAG: 4'-phosphopantetheinyl transferase family protein [Anaerovoracaceae bacterium]|jgi:4'-phosphopantetheinyl transferase
MWNNKNETVVFIVDILCVPRSSSGYRSDLLLRYALNQLGFTGPLQMERGPYGKPFLVGKKTPFFSISHSAGLMVCGVGEVELGLDLQCVRKDIKEAINTVLSQEERESFYRLPGDERWKYFAKCWAIKESYVKYLGTGLSIDPAKILWTEEGGVFAQGKKPGYYRELKIGKGYVSIICAERPLFPKLVRLTDKQNQMLYG